MGRKSTFRETDIYAAVGRSLVGEGEFRLQSLTELTGVSVGSLYHRFGSREALLAEAWLDALEAFQARFLAALDDARDGPGIAAALATPRFCRDQPARATLLVCCRRSELMGDDAPAPLRARLEMGNRTVAQAMTAFCDHTGLPVEAARLGLIGFPLGAVKLYLPDKPVPGDVDEDIAAAWTALYRRHVPD